MHCFQHLFPLITGRTKLVFSRRRPYTNPRREMVRIMPVLLLWRAALKTYLQTTFNFLLTCFTQRGKNCIQIVLYEIKSEGLAAMIARQTAFTAPYFPADDGAATSQHLLGMLYGLHLTLHMPMFTHGTRRGLSPRSAPCPLPLGTGTRPQRPPTTACVPVCTTTQCIGRGTCGRS